MSDQVGKEGASASNPLRDWGLGFSPMRETIVKECGWARVRGACLFNKSDAFSKAVLHVTDVVMCLQRWF